jgi:hypothetical protein
MGGLEELTAFTYNVVRLFLTNLKMNQQASSKRRKIFTK